MYLLYYDYCLMPLLSVYNGNNIENFPAKAQINTRVILALFLTDNQTCVNLYFLLRKAPVV